jgi:hypothetical protein
MIDRDSQMSQMRETGAKGKKPEDQKGMDARDLIARFRSKSDLYKYLYNIVSAHFHLLNPLQFSSTCRPGRR